MMNMTPHELDEKRRQFFNDHAAGWRDMFYKDESSGRYDRFRERFERLFAMTPVAEGNAVLDVGCGVGVLVPFILERIGPGGRLVELDYAEKMIEENRRLHPDPRIVFLSADVMKAELEAEGFDWIMVFSCFPHFQDKPAALGVLNRALKPGGAVIVAHFDSSEDLNKMHATVKGPVMHDRLPSGDEMRELFHDAGFAVPEFIDEKGFYFLKAVKK